MRRGKPLKRTGSLVRKTQLKGKSKPTSKEIYKQALARDLGCCGTQLPGKCGGRIDPHHIKMRSQGGEDTLDNLVCLCRVHHSWVHEHPDESYRLGYLKHGWE